MGPHPSRRGLSYQPTSGWWPAEHYNYFRDYDPGIGRYVESDPKGIRGGYNTYGYVQAQPLVAIDALGLYTYEPSGKGLNTVVCDGTSDDPVPQLDNTNGEINRQCLGGCMFAHEMNHIKDLLRIGKAPCRGKPKGTVVKFDTTGQTNRSELASYNVEIDCLFWEIGHISLRCPCNTIVENRIKQLFQLRKRYE